MQHEFDAIYENGVLRPLEPIELPERSRVHVTLSENGNSVSEAELERQRTSVARLISEMENLPSQSAVDGFTGRDHDKLLYGWDKK